MKKVKSFLVAGLFFMVLVFVSCNPHAANNTTSNTMSSEGLDSPSIANTGTKKDSVTHSDTIVTQPNDSMKKNNPDITK